MGIPPLGVLSSRSLSLGRFQFSQALLQTDYLLAGFPVVDSPALANVVARTCHEITCCPVRTHAGVTVHRVGDACIVLELQGRLP